MHLRRIVPLFFTLLALGGCSTEQSIWEEDGFETQAHPIINGTRVTGNNRLSTVLLYYSYYDQTSPFCTGTLITDRHVLTAAHCVSTCGEINKDELLDYMRIGIGQSIDSLNANYGWSKIYKHDQFMCSKSEENGDISKHDIAIIQLSSPVPSSVAEPAQIIPEGLGPRADEIDYAPGSYVNLVGFGLTNVSDDSSAGVKYETRVPVMAYCSNYPNKVVSELCNDEDAFADYEKGVIFLYGKNSISCQGDSGGPAFYTRNGKEYVLGVTSYGDRECSILAAYTAVDDYRDFIYQAIPSLASSGVVEICDNSQDDDGDGQTDCFDPDCAYLTECQPEDCTNGIDDNGNGKRDCEDSQCYQHEWCQTEHCDNGIDDNLDGLADCDDPTCMLDAACMAFPLPAMKENCSNQIDDNGDGLTDCDDPNCMNDSACKGPQPNNRENCTNNIDDNNDGLIDCNDPLCINTSACDPSSNPPIPKVENCTNNIDDDYNGLIDCNDPYCMHESICAGGNYGNPSDSSDTGNNPLSPGGSAGSGEQAGQEICDNEVDDNGDGLVDCDDPKCESACGPLHSLFNSSSSSEACAAAPKGSHDAPIGFGLTILGLMGLARIRRRPQNKSGFLDHSVEAFWERQP